MTTKKVLSEEEFSEMLGFIERFVETELDQFELWKMDVKGDPIYIEISMAPAAEGAESAYTDLTHLLKGNKK